MNNFCIDNVFDAIAKIAGNSFYFWLICSKYAETMHLHIGIKKFHEGLRQIMLINLMRFEDVRSREEILVENVVFRGLAESN